MKKIITLIAALLLAIPSFAQQGINYKAVIKDDAGNVVVGQNVGVQFQIREATANGSTVYTETHTSTTDANGILILNIGTGTTTDTFNTIDWSSNEHWLNLQIDITGGTNYADISTTQFMAVPYALHALTSTDGYWNQDESTIYYNDGDIGIGTNAPLGKLGINHNGSISNPQLYLHETDNDYARINFKNNNGVNYWSIAAYTASNLRNDRLNFSNGVGGDVLSLKGDGKIGFGVSNPRVKFHFAGEQGFLFGTDTIGPGSKIMYIANKKAFRIGTLLSGAGSVYWDDTSYDDATSGVIDYVGNYSFATGINNRAQGFGATAMGRDTEASNSYAFASGYFSNADGQYSTAMGFNTVALGRGSTSLGYSTNAIGDYSTSIGNETSTLGNYSTSMGNNTIAVAEASTAIGKYNVADINGLFMVGNGTGTSAANRKNAFIIKEDGKIGVNTSTPASLFEVAHGDVSPTFADRTNALSIRRISNGRSWQFYTQSDGYLLLFSDGNYRGSFNATSGAYVQASDRRVKKDITPLESGTLNKVMELNPVSYLMKDQTDTNRNLGLISQEVQEIFPSLTHYVEESDLLTLSYTELIPILIKALQEQQTIIDAQNSKLTTQDSKIENLTAEIGQFKTLELRVKQLENTLKIIAQ